MEILPLDTFKTVIASTPLISIDFIIRDSEGRVLLGKRLNRPAQGYWFVPGGRILKDEPVQVAINRLIQEELGVRRVEPEFKGVYQHFYDENFFNEKFSTHYVVLALEVYLSESLSALPLKQHSTYKWFTVNDLLECKETHLHTKWYFQPEMQAVSQMQMHFGLF